MRTPRPGAQVRDRDFVTTVIFPMPIDLLGAFTGQPADGRVPTPAAPGPRVGGDD